MHTYTPYVFQYSPANFLKLQFRSVLSKEQSLTMNINQTLRGQEVTHTAQATVSNRVQKETAHPATCS